MWIIGEYYRLLAVLQCQLESQTTKRALKDGDDPAGLTFQRLLVWTKEPKARMKLLAAMVEACQGHRGGALASVIHSFVLQGNVTLREVVLKILVQVQIHFLTFSLVSNTQHDRKMTRTRISIE